VLPNTDIFFSIVYIFIDIDAIFNFYDDIFLLVHAEQSIINISHVKSSLRSHDV